MFLISPAHKAALNARAEEAARQGLPPQQQSAHELDATDTYKIFSALMNVTGEGDKDELGILGKVQGDEPLTTNKVIKPQTQNLNTKTRVRRSSIYKPLFYR